MFRHSALVAAVHHENHDNHDLMTGRNKNKWPGKGSSDDKPDNLVFILTIFSAHCSLYSRIIFTNSAFKQFELFSLQCSIMETGPTGLFMSYNTI